MGTMILGDKVRFTVRVAGSDNAARVVHEAGGATDGSLFFDEIGEGDFDVGGCGVQMLLHLVENLGKLLEGHFGTENVEQLDETAHMGALVFVGQIHIHVDGGYRVLKAVLFVQDADRISNVLDTDLVDGDSAVIPLVLDVFHLAGYVMGSFE